MLRGHAPASPRREIRHRDQSEHEDDHPAFAWVVLAVAVGAVVVTADPTAEAEELRFEYAAKLRDEIRDLKRELDQAVAIGEAPPGR